jgi:hypothetical protein
MHVLSIKHDVTAGGLLHTIQNLHERRLAGAIFPDYCQYFFAMQSYAYIIIGNQPVIMLDYVVHPEHWLAALVMHRSMLHGYAVEMVSGDLLWQPPEISEHWKVYSL